MLAAIDRDFKLGANAVRRGNKDGILVTGGLQVKEGSESAKPRIGASPRRGLGQRLDRVNQRISGIDIDPGFGIGSSS